MKPTREMRPIRNTAPRNAKLRTTHCIGLVPSAVSLSEQLQVSTKNTAPTIAWAQLMKRAILAQPTQILETQAGKSVYNAGRSIIAITKGVSSVLIAVQDYTV